ncbi:MULTISPECIES: CcdB family protein [unclassified Rhizobium]|uniref:CcdB family protein n=1 Tax=unclassified Rhizobium TaxID=2613769 RepID=UPI001ADBC63C|nr:MULTISPECIES: CcdB family protein [unclassified Rhizobium]MBO9122292.1 CcdB family protein [Rhizobium sp. 16-488-2b]MBO9172638.1 CcdB family protein [Rhizobium sp. 16-488-2a]
MARFHVYRLRHEQTLVLDLQSNLLDELTTRMVAPLLLPGELTTTVRQLNPQFTIDNAHYVMATQFIGVVPLSDLGYATADLTRESHRITGALDFLFQGF